MPEITLRFYEELNDFLPQDLRKRSFNCSYTPKQAVKQVIENQGVPHTEVEVILVNGESVAFDYRLQPGDRVSVYPMFESMDVTPLLRLRPKPLRQLRFIADAHLGKLTRYLRLLGFDCLFFNDAGDSELARISAQQKRVLLTRDRGLLMHRVITHGCFIHATEPKRQLLELVERLQLQGVYNPFSRCMECNGCLAAVDKERIQDQLPARVRQHYADFWRCDACGRIYWKGSHYQEMQAFIDTLMRRQTKQ
ncbi:MAG: Mut7-C RNAse domain-containing protein [Candidatus Thiodiazotropha sp.]